jgi:thiamine-monophosphate kinase
MPASEFDIIEQVFRARATSGTGVICGIGDDAAVLSVPPGEQLVVSTDTLISGVHFFADGDPYDTGYRSLAVNLSDMAAMGAVPAWMTLALTLPENDITWLHKFADGLFDLADRFGVSLTGGNMAHGPLSITITIMGTVPSGKALYRSGAQTGDLIYVTGQPGMAALALAIITGELSWQGPAPIACIERLRRPLPRVQAGLLIRDLASACIDISDGLAADLAHLLRASGKGARIRLASLPLDPSFARLTQEQKYTYALCRGDDYELCFTLPAQHRPVLQQLEQQAGCQFSCIGEVMADATLHWIDANGSDIYLAETGYQHFRD